MRRRKRRTPVVPEIAPVPPEEREAFEQLLAIARNRTGKFGPERVARHVLRVTVGGDWPLRVAAMDAVLRRFRAAESDGLVARAGSKACDYRTSINREDRPYHTSLAALEPIRASCDCRDFLRNSLGLCKHVVAVLLAGFLPPSTRAGRLEWNAVRPLTGPGEPLDRLRWRDGGTDPDDDAYGLFFESNGTFRPVAPLPTDDAKRLDAVRTLQDQRPVHPAPAKLLAREADRLVRRLSDRGLVAGLEKHLAGLKRPLFPYQLDGVRRFLTAGRLLLADDMGLGKTAQAIASCVVLWNADRARRGLLVVPAALKSQWLHEWKSFTDVPVELLTGGVEDRERQIRRLDSGFLIAGYEQAVRDIEALRKWNPALVVVDEAQRMKNWETKTALSVKRIAAPWRLVLTGTPMENRLEELASLLDYVDDMALEPKWRLAPWHTETANDGADHVGARHLDTLRARLEPCFLRRRKAEVLAQLPAKTVTRVPVEISNEQWAAHEELSPAIAQLVARARRRPLTQPEFLRLMTLLTTQRMICNGLALRDFTEVFPTLPARATDAALERLSSPKLAEIRELVARLAVDQGRKVVIFSQWRRMLRLASWAIGGVLADAGLRAAWFTGAESQDARTRHLVDFHDDPATRILFCSDAGGVGLNLQKAAHCVVNLELPWNPAVLEQRTGRVWRLGQEEHVEVYDLASEYGIEARIASLVADKKALFTGLFDGDSDSVKYEGSGTFLSKMEKIVGTGAGPALPAEPDRTTDPTRVPELETLAEPVPEATPPVIVPPPKPPDLAAVLSTLKVTAGEDGGLRIEAPKEAAAALASVFAMLAKQLSAAAPEPRP